MNSKLGPILVSARSNNYSNPLATRNYSTCVIPICFLQLLAMLLALPQVHSGPFSTEELIASGLLERWKWKKRNKYRVFHRVNEDMPWLTQTYPVAEPLHINNPYSTNRKLPLFAPPTRPPYYKR